MDSKLSQLSGNAISVGNLGETNAKDHQEIDTTRENIAVGKERFAEKYSGQQRKVQKLGHTFFHEIQEVLGTM